jgi:tetratricopeptide (TPR) repeat protein/WD40 repeat protein
MKIDPDTLPLPKEPYRGILPFRLLDWRIFLERDVETERLGNLVTMYGGVLLYGQSGAGKSSLLDAGLLPDVLRRGGAPERIRVFPKRGNELLVERIPLHEANPSGPLDQGHARCLPSRFTTADSDESVALSCNRFFEILRMPSDLGVPLLIFDQFEELVTRFEENQTDLEELKAARAAREAIENLLCKLLLNDLLPLKVVFAFRGDYLDRLEPFFSRIPNLMDQSVHLAPPRMQALHGIVRGPFVTSEYDGRGLPSHFGHELSEALVERLAEGIRTRRPSGVLNLTEVQRLCRALWRQEHWRDELLQADTPHKTLEKIMESEAKTDLGNLLPLDKIRAIALLSNLVTKDGTRDVVSEENLIAETRRHPLMWSFRAGWPRLLNEIQQKTGLLRRSVSARTRYYEVASEFLIPWIQKQQQALRIYGSGLIFAFAMLLVCGIVFGVVAFANRNIEERRRLETAERAAVNADAKTRERDEAISEVIVERIQTELNKTPPNYIGATLLAKVVRDSMVDLPHKEVFSLLIRPPPFCAVGGLQLKSAAQQVAFDPEGTRLVARTDAGEILFIDLATGKYASLPARDNGGTLKAQYFDFAPLPHTVLALRTSEDIIERWDWRDSKWLRPLRLRRLKEKPRSNSDKGTTFGARQEIAGDSTTSGDNGAELRVPNRQDSNSLPVAFSPDGDWIAVARGDASINLVCAAPVEGPDTEINSKEIANNEADLASRRDVEKTRDEEESDRARRLLNRVDYRRSRTLDDYRRLRALAMEDRLPEMGRRSFPMRTASTLCFLQGTDLLIAGGQDGFWPMRTSDLHGVDELYTSGDRQGLAVSWRGGSAALFAPWSEPRVTAEFTIKTKVPAEFDAASPQTHQLPGEILSIASDPAGLYAAFGLDNGTVTLKRDGRLVQDLQHPGRIQALAFRLDGRMLVSASNNGTLRFWTPFADDPKVTHFPIPSFSGTANGVALSVDGKRIASLRDDEVVVQDNASGRVLLRFPLGNGDPLAVAVGEHGALAVVHYGAAISFVGPQPPNGTVNTEGSAQAWLNGDGSRLALLDKGKRLRIMNTNRLDQPAMEIPLSAAGSPISGTGSESFPNVKNEPQPLSVDRKPERSHCAFSPDDARLAFHSADAGTINLYPLRSGAPPFESFPAPGVDIAALAFGPGGQTLFCASRSGALTILDLAKKSGEISKLLTVDSFATSIGSLAVSGDGSVCAFTDGDEVRVLRRNARLPDEQLGQLDGQRLRKLTLIRSVEKEPTFPKFLPAVSMGLGRFWPVWWQTHHLLRRADARAETPLASDALEPLFVELKEIETSYPDIPAPALQAMRELLAAAPPWTDVPSTTKLAARISRLDAASPLERLLLLRDGILPNLPAHHSDRPRMLFQLAQTCAARAYTLTADEGSLKDSLIKQAFDCANEAESAGFLRSRPKSDSSPFTAQYSYYRVSVSDLEKKGREFLNKNTEDGNREAEWLCRLVIFRDPSNYTANLNLGLVLGRMYRNDEAISCFQKAADAPGTDNLQKARAYSNMAHRYETKGERSRMYEAINKAIGIQPDYVYALNARGGFYFDDKKWDNAKADFEASMRVPREDLTSSSLAGYFGLAKVLLKLGENQKAVGTIENATKLAPDDAEIWKDAADAIWGSEDPKRKAVAFAFYSKAIAIEPKKASRYFDRGYRFSLAKKKPEAIRDLDKAVDLEPKSEVTRRMFGWTLFNLGEPRRALKEWETARALVKEPLPDLLAGLSLGYWQCGQHDKGIEQYRLLIVKQPQFSEAEYVKKLDWDPKEIEVLERIRLATIVPALVPQQ